MSEIGLGAEVMSRYLDAGEARGLLTLAEQRLSDMPVEGDRTVAADILDVLVEATGQGEQFATLAAPGTEEGTVRVSFGSMFHVAAGVVRSRRQIPSSPAITDARRAIEAAWQDTRSTI